MKHKILTLLIILLSPILLAVQYNGDDMVDFTAYIAKDKVNIQWRANDRDKIKSYNLERSQDGKEFDSFKEILDEGESPRIAEFIESDFSPFQGWSYYRIRYETNKGKIYVTHAVPVFYKADRLQKGEIIVPNNLGDNESKSSTESAESFNGQRLVFVLRDKDGAEFYVEETVTVDGDKLYLPKSDIVGEGDYMITASTKIQLLGLEITVR